jgi:hypothetical protein
MYGNKLDSLNEANKHSASKMAALFCGKICDFVARMEDSQNMVIPATADQMPCNNLYHV